MIEPKITPLAAEPAPVLPADDLDPVEKRTAFPESPLSELEAYLAAQAAISDCRRALTRIGDARRDRGGELRWALQVTRSLRLHLQRLLDIHESAG